MNEVANLKKHGSFQMRLIDFLKSGSRDMDMDVVQNLPSDVVSKAGDVMQPKSNEQINHSNGREQETQKSFEKGFTDLIKSCSRDLDFIGLISEMIDVIIPIREKYQGPYHPHLTMMMLLAANLILEKRVIIAKDEQNFFSLYKKLHASIPVTHGTDDPNISIAKLDELLLKFCAAAVHSRNHSRK